MKGVASLSSAASGFLHVSVSGLPELFAEWIPKELMPCRSRDKSKRPYNNAMVFWLFLSQCLARGQACRETIHEFIALLEIKRKPSVSENTSAYCQARRKKLRAEFLDGVNQHIFSEVDSQIPAELRWHGKRVGVVDGSTVSMPDTASNQTCYPQPSEQKQGCGFPVMKVLALFSITTGLWHRLSYSNLRTSERTLFRQLWDGIRGWYDIILGDRGFVSYFDMHELKKRGIDSVFRQHKCRSSDFRYGKRLGKDDHLVMWQKPDKCPNWLTPEQFANAPEQLSVREVRAVFSRKGFRTKSCIIVTTLLDPIVYPASDLAELYFLRWSAELRLRDIKCTLGLDVLRCKSPEMIQKELWMQVIAYNLIRAFMLKTAMLKNQPLSRISFKGTVGSVRTWAPHLVVAAAYNQEEYFRLLKKLTECISKDIVPLRPNRSEPRAKKRRPKNYQLLTKPRQLMGNLPHRNRPKKQPLSPKT